METQNNPVVPEVKKPEDSLAARQVQAQVNLDNFDHCFRCGFAKEYGAKLKVVGNEKVCQNCRRAEVDKEFE